MNPHNQAPVGELYLPETPVPAEVKTSAKTILTHIGLCRYGIQMNTFKQAHKIKELVRVAVVFGGPGRRIKPVWFDWNRQKHTVQETTYIWESHYGDARLIHFAVRDDGGLYELIYNTKDNTWILEGVVG